MATGRGLNKNRGLGALIPPKTKTEEADSSKMVDITKGEPKKTAAKPAAKKAAAAKEAYARELENTLAEEKSRAEAQASSVVKQVVAMLTA